MWEEFGINHETTPNNIATFMANAEDRLLARRNHACVFLWCTANEGGPTEPITSAMPKLVERLDGTRFYLQHSIMPPTDGDGTYETHEPLFYFKKARGFHPEGGSHTVPAVESLRRMMPHEKLWPVNPTWATHDWIQRHNGFASRPTEEAIAAYGAPVGIEDFCRKAQMVNMETFKAIFESCNDKMLERLHGHDDLDEQSLLAVAGLEHLRLLFRADGGVLRLQESLRAGPRAVERGLGRSQGGQRHARRSRRADGGRRRVQYGGEPDSPAFRPLGLPRQLRNCGIPIFRKPTAARPRSNSSSWNSRTARAAWCPTTSIGAARRGPTCGIWRR